MPPDALEFVESRAKRSTLYPQSGWLHHYLNYAESVTDAPSIFHLATGLAIVGATLGNRCWIKASGQRVFPAMWSVLVGASSSMRKTSSMRRGGDLLTRQERGLPEQNGTRGPSIRIPLPGSPEGFEDALAKRGDRLMIVSEFGGLLSRMEREHMGSLKERLTEWYDGDSMGSVTMARGTAEVKDPALSIIAGTTPEWLEDRIKEGDVRGGFIARFLFWPASKSDKLPWKNPLEVVENEAMIDQLTMALNHMRRFQGEFRPVQEAKDGWGAFVRPIDEEEDPRLTGDLQGFAHRLPMNTLKIAMCVEAAAMMGAQGARPAMEISAQSMNQAVRIAQWQADKTSELFGGDEGLKYTKGAAEQRKLMRLLEQHGVVVDGAKEISQRELMRKTGMVGREMTMFADALAQSGRIEIVRRSPEGGGRPSIVYRRVS